MFTDLANAHSVRFDRYDNLWVVDKGENTVIKFNPGGMVVMNLGRRPEGPDEPEYYDPRKVAQNPPRQADGYLNGSTDVTWDAQDNIYVSDGGFARTATHRRTDDLRRLHSPPSTKGIWRNEAGGLDAIQHTEMELACPVGPRQRAPSMRNLTL